MSQASILTEQIINAFQLGNTNELFALMHQLTALKKETFNEIYNRCIIRLMIVSPDIIKCIQIFYQTICADENLCLSHKISLLFGIKRKIMTDDNFNNYREYMIYEIDHLIISSIINFASVLNHDLCTEINKLNESLKIVSIKTIPGGRGYSFQESSNKELMISTIKSMISTRPIEIVSISDRKLLLQLNRNMRFLPCMLSEMRTPRILFTLISACRGNQINRCCVFIIMQYWSFFPNNIVLINFINYILFRLF